MRWSGAPNTSKALSAGCPKSLWAATWISLTPLFLVEGEVEQAVMAKNAKPAHRLCITDMVVTPSFSAFSAPNNGVFKVVFASTVLLCRFLFGLLFPIRIQQHRFYRFPVTCLPRPPFRSFPTLAVSSSPNCSCSRSLGEKMRTANLDLKTINHLRRTAIPRMQSGAVLQGLLSILTRCSSIGLDTPVLPIRRHSSKHHWDYKHAEPANADKSAGPLFDDDLHLIAIAKRGR
ncbi:hypothetical protein C4J99_3725 [Pseudomonas synxantha]|nr:hypothetical protein C4J99_3725 [Pseudomonas synxantha]